MKIKPLLIGLLLYFCFPVLGCIQAPVVPPRGILFTYYKAPLSLKFKDTPVGEREGTGEAVWFKEPFIGTTWGLGNISLKTAAEANSIKEIDYIDYEYISVLGIFQRIRIIPHGT